MRLLNVDVITIDFTQRLQIVLDASGVVKSVIIDVPVGWDTWTRQEKVDWCKAWVTSHASTHQYLSGTDVVFPDAGVKDQALIDFDTLPGFASWTASEAADWIDTNVVDLESAKVALTRLAQAVVYLRDIVISRI